MVESFNSFDFENREDSGVVGWAWMLKTGPVLARPVVGRALAQHKAHRKVCCMDSQDSGGAGRPRMLKSGPVRARRVVDPALAA